MSNQTERTSTSEGRRAAALAEEVARKLGREVRHMLIFKRRWPRGGEERAPMHFGEATKASRCGDDLCRSGIATAYWVKPILVQP